MPAKVTQKMVGDFVSKIHNSRKPLSGPRKEHAGRCVLESQQVDSWNLVQKVEQTAPLLHMINNCVSSQLLYTLWLIYPVSTLVTALSLSGRNILDF